MLAVLVDALQCAQTWPALAELMVLSMLSRQCPERRPWTWPYWASLARRGCFPLAASTVMYATHPEEANSECAA